MENKDKHLFRLAGALAALFVGRGNEEDRQVVERWVDGDERRADLVRGIMNRERFEANLEESRRYSSGAAWRRARGRLEARRRWRGAWYSAAAVVLLAVAAAVFLSRETARPLAEEAVVFPSGTTGALLTLDDGRVVNIDKETSLQVTERDGTTIVVDSGAMGYRVAGEPPVAVAYNEVRTPTGMEFPLTLSDGTRVYLNAESRLRFPVSFSGERREVELEGEAFFEVRGEARPFVARAGGVETVVLGTSFNIRAYGDERSVVATLLEGRVALRDGVGEWLLAPGEQGSYARATGECAVRPVDANLYAAWRSGKFIFRNERLEDILSYLSRWYGFAYEFHDEEARGIELGANLDRYRDMEPIIRMLEDSRLARVARSGNKLDIYSYK
ncbi:MAG: FecR domain-containing protein [Odoribacteraceae bacterium]|jgi:ferric-dicitrate binding protein FerR (iron transport regulator)|nr:FecR domain-containing protein [Odoribacteraceae bacterium]